METDPKKDINLDEEELKEEAVDEEDAGDIVTEDGASVQKLIELQDSKTKRERARNLAEATKYVKEVKERPPVKTWGYSIDHNDPVNGYTEDQETINEFLKKDLEKNPVLEPSDKIEPISRAAQADAVESLANAPIEAPIDQAPEVKAEAEKSTPEFITERNEERLIEVFEKSQEIRGDYKNPGNPRYRLMSVAAGDLWKIKQPEKVADRVDAINDAITNAVKTAFGSEELDDYAKDTLAAAKLYFSETMIGEDADSVSIGTTETLVNSNGQIGDKPEIYGNMVVIRWIKNNINHVVAFSPKEGTGIYALVDDSMGDSWKEKFIRAGAVDRDERKAIFTMDHEDRDEFYHHEKSFEKVAKRMILKELATINSNEVEVEDMEKVVSACHEELRKLAHLKTDIVENTSVGGMRGTVGARDKNSGKEHKDAE